MKQRLIALQCDAEQATELANVVRAYASAAYPPGGSECAQVAREALLDAAETIAAHPGGQLEIRKRLLPQIRAAVHWCLSQDAPAGVECAPTLTTVVAKKTKSAV